MSKEIVLNEDRFFDPDSVVRKIARELYDGVKDLPIISPHGHTDLAWFSENKPFPDPTGLILIPDHYIFRMLYSQGIPMERLGIPTQDSSPVEKNHRKIWQIFGEHFYLYAGTPTGIWLTHEFCDVFGIREKLNGESALRIYDQIQEKLESPGFLPRAMFDRFNIELLSTTDPAESRLEHHLTIRNSDWKRRIVPAFRPDGVTDIGRKDWQQNIQELSGATNIDINSYQSFIQALEKQREFFKSMGATSTDHGVNSPYTHELSPSETEAIFGKALPRVDFRRGKFSRAAQFGAPLHGRAHHRPGQLHVIGLGIVVAVDRLEAVRLQAVQFSPFTGPQFTKAILGVQTAKQRVQDQAGAYRQRTPRGFRENRDMERLRAHQRRGELQQ